MFTILFVKITYDYATRPLFHNRYAWLAWRPSRPRIDDNGHMSLVDERLNLLLVAILYSPGGENSLGHKEQWQYAWHSIISESTRNRTILRTAPGEDGIPIARQGDVAVIVLKDSTIEVSLKSGEAVSLYNKMDLEPFSNDFRLIVKALAGRENELYSETLPSPK
jgi:hypothetical protein